MKKATHQYQNTYNNHLSNEIKFLRAIFDIKLKQNDEIKFTECHIFVKTQ